MGTLNIASPNVPQRNNMGAQLGVTALEMLLKRHLDKLDSQRAEAGANTFVQMQKGLPTQTEETPTGVIREDFKPNALESMLSSEDIPMKKEPMGLPTPPAKTETPELDKMLAPPEPEAPETPAMMQPPLQEPKIEPAYARNMPPQMQSPTPQVPSGQSAAAYPGLTEHALYPPTAISYDAQGNMKLVTRQPGQELGQKPTNVAAGQATIYDKQGNAFLVNKGTGQTRPIMAPGGTQQMAKETGIDVRNAMVEGQQKGRVAGVYFDPNLGYARPFTQWEVRQTMENKGPDALPVDKGEYDKVAAVAGRQVAVFNAAENARQAALAAVRINGGLNFNPDAPAGETGMSMRQIAEYVARLTHSNDVIDSNLLTTYMHSLVNASMDPETRNYANHLLTLYEAGVGANSLIGGSAQTSDMRYRALLAALPGPADSKLADIEGKINRFETDVALSVSTLPRIRMNHGYTIQDINAELHKVQQGMPYEQSAIAKLAGTAGTTVAPTAQQAIPGAIPPRPTTAPTAAPAATPAVAPRVRKFKADGTEITTP